ncbi:MAG: hypothetical protein AAF611_10895 [Bacteroidota bacterium]
MKKKNLKSLSLKKASVSKLNGGAPISIELTKPITVCDFTFGIDTQCTTTWISELNTACCPPTQGFDCNSSFLDPCEFSIDVPCQPF